MSKIIALVLIFGSALVCLPFAALLGFAPVVVALSTLPGAACSVGGFACVTYAIASQE